MRRVVRIESGKKDVEREIALHLELRAKEFEAGGMSPEAAREAALEAFGDRMEIESEVTEITRRLMRPDVASGSSCRPTSWRRRSRRSTSHARRSPRARPVRSTVRDAP